MIHETTDLVSFRNNILKRINDQMINCPYTLTNFRFINDELKAEGGIVTMDSDHEDSQLISVFLLEFLINSKNFELVPVARCF